MYFIFQLLLFLFIKSTWALSPQPLVLVVSYDAFRYNYIDKGVTPTLAQLKETGCYADYLDNVFITKTFPNHASIATGLYTEVHGVLGNSVYDQGLEKKLDYGYELYHYNEGVVPIWIENERRGGGRRSGLMMWPGNNFNYTGRMPTFHQAFNEKLPWKQRVDTAISWYHHPDTPVNFVMMYIEEPDGHGHAFGPDSQEGLETLRTMDTVTKYILEKVDKANLRDKLNLFFISDHGMHSVTKRDILDLRPFVNESLYDTYELSPTLHVYPKKGKAKEVYDGLMRAVNALGGFKVYRPQDLLPRWHYSHNRRTPPMLLVADPPHVFHDFYEMITFFEKKFNFTSTDNSTFGVHGYDNQEESMRPYFIASGPAIKNKTRVPPFRTIDLFSIWAELLGFPEAGAATNGSAIPAQTVLKSQQPIATASIATGIIGAALVLIAMAITVYFVHKKLQFKYHRLMQTDVPAHDSTRQRLLDSEEEEP